MFTNLHTYTTQFVARHHATTAQVLANMGCRVTKVGQMMRVDLPQRCKETFYGDGLYSVIVIGGLAIRLIEDEYGQYPGRCIVEDAPILA